MHTPLVIAMPKPMAEALGWPDKPIGWSDILALATDPAGWASLRPSRVGPVPARQDQPQLLDQRPARADRPGYAATGKTTRPVARGPGQPRRSRRSTSGRVGGRPLRRHHADLPQQLVPRRPAGHPLTYASAVAVEEKSVIDYNSGNPDGVLDPGEEPRKPRIPLVAIYPKEGTLYSDSPLFVLDAPWVTDDQRQGAQRSGLRAAARRTSGRCCSSASARATRRWPSARRSRRPTASTRTSPRPCCRCPSPPVMVELLDKWGTQRKGARVLLVLDVSGSMERPGRPPTASETKLDLAKQAAIDALDQFKPDDQVGLRVFSTDLGPQNEAIFLDLVPDRTDRRPTGGAARRRSATSIPTDGTPLYEVTGRSFEQMVDEYDPDPHQRRRAADRRPQRRRQPERRRPAAAGLLADLRRDARARTAKPVRIFPIAYGSDADVGVLQQIAEATNGASLRRQRPEDDHQGVHRGGEQLLTMALLDRSATGSSPRRSPGRSRRRRRSCWPGRAWPSACVVGLARSAPPSASARRPGPAGRGGRPPQRARHRASTRSGSTNRGGAS